MVLTPTGADDNEQCVTTRTAPVRNGVAIIDDTLAVCVVFSRAQCLNNLFV